MLGRANRVAPNKPPVRVLDFVNSASEIGAAFATFADGARCRLASNERRKDAAAELAFISEQVLACVQAGSSAAAAASPSPLSARLARCCVPLSLSARRCVPFSARLARC